MIHLTPRQQECLTFIRSYRERYSVSPSYADIAEVLGTASRGYVHQLLRELAGVGVIKVHHRRRGGIELVEPGHEHAITLSDEIHRLLADYAATQRIVIDTAANELLRQALGADR